MILDKNGKIGGKLNIVDAAAILLVIVIIAGICVRFGSKFTTAVESSETFEYVIKIQGIREYTVDALEKGGIVTDKNSDEILGKIKDVQVEGAYDTRETADGQIVDVEIPEKYNCYVTIEAEGKESDDVYIMSDTTELSVGKSIDLYTRYCQTSGVIKKVTKLD